MSRQISALPMGRFTPSVPIEPQTRETSAVKPGLFWVFGENIKGPLYLYRLSTHRYPAPAIQEIRRMSHSDTSLLMDRLLKEIERHEDEMQVIHKRSGDIVAVSAEIADVEPIIAGCFDLDMSCEIPAQPKDTVQPANATRDRLTLWESRSTDLRFLAKEQDAAAKAIASLGETLQVLEASIKLLQERYYYASYSMAGENNIRAAFQDVVLRAEQQVVRAKGENDESNQMKGFVRSIVGS